MTVAGKRYGKGSSREHSPAAERLAGIRLVVAESFERIYRQNADNIGLFTSTDFGLIARIQAAEAIPIDDLVAGRDALAAAILRSGGLLHHWMVYATVEILVLAALLQLLHFYPKERWWLLPALLVNGTAILLSLTRMAAFTSGSKSLRISVARDSGDKSRWMSSLATRSPAIRLTSP